MIEIHRTKGGMPLYKCKLRCKALFPGNLDVFFLVDYPNVPLTVEKSLEGKDEIILKLYPDRAAPIDSARATRFYEFLEEALAFWSVCMVRLRPTASHDDLLLLRKLTLLYRKPKWSKCTPIRLPSRPVD